MEKRAQRLTWPVLLCAVGACQCGPAETPKTDQADGGSYDAQIGPTYASLDDRQRVVLLGGSMAAAKDVPLAASFGELLLNNDDEGFPDFADRDLDTLRPGSDRFGLAIDSARVADVKTTQLPNVPDDATLIIVAIGIDDYLDAAGTTLQVGTDQAADFGAALEQALIGLRDSTRFAVLPHVYVINTIDPADGASDADAVYGGSWPAAAPVLAAFNAEISRAANAHSARLVDAQLPFLGHGNHFDDRNNPNYESSDPTLWLQTDGIHLNRRGHSEVRRLLLNSILGSN